MSATDTREGRSRDGKGRTENDIGFLDALVDLCRKMEILASARLDHLVEAGLVDGQMVAVPRFDARLRDIDNGDLDFGAFQRDHRHCLQWGWSVEQFAPRYASMLTYRAADVAGANAADLETILGGDRHHGCAAL